MGGGGREVHPVNLSFPWLYMGSRFQQNWTDIVHRLLLLARVLLGWQKWEALLLFEWVCVQTVLLFGSNLVFFHSHVSSFMQLQRAGLESGMKASNKFALEYKKRVISLGQSTDSTEEEAICLITFWVRAVNFFPFKCNKKGKKLIR